MDISKLKEPGNELILFYNLEGKEKADEMKFLMMMMGIRLREVKAEEYHQKLGYLAGLPGYEALPAPAGESSPFTEEMLVFVGFEGTKLDEFLAKLRYAQVEPVGLKAMLTPTNKNWTSYELYGEISKEHAMMTGKKKNS